MSDLLDGEGRDEDGRLRAVGRGAPRRRWMRLVAVAVFAALAGLALWPAAPVGHRGDPREGADCGAKLATLAMAAATGRAVERTLSERELNAHLGGILERSREAQESRGLTIGLTDLRLDLEPRRVRVFVSGLIVVVPLVFEARYVDAGGGVHRARGEDSPLRLESLRLGRLPLIGPFKLLVASQMRSLGKRLSTERAVLESFSAVAMEEDRLRVVVDGDASGELILGN